MNINREDRTMDISSRLAVVEDHGFMAASAGMPDAQNELQTRRLAKQRAGRLTAGVANRATLPLDTRDRLSLDQMPDPIHAVLTVLARQIEEARDVGALTKIAETARRHGQSLKKA
jgi:hypothetical protein